MNFQDLNNKAKEHYNNKEFDKALELLNHKDLPIQLVPNLARCFYYTKQAHKARDLLDPLEKDESLYVDMALYTNAIGEFDKAFDILDKLDPKNPYVSFNKGWHLLRKNRFLEGFEQLETGRSLSVWGAPFDKKFFPENKVWQGQFADHLVLFLEGGLGDQIIFLRWADYLKTKCNILTIVCENSLLRLFTNAGYNVIPDTIFANPNISFNRFEYDYFIPGMALPYLLKIDHPQTHVNFPYIKSHAEPYFQRALNDCAQGRLKIGIKWFGNTKFEHDQFRTVPKAALKGLSKFGQLFSLQFEDHEDQSIPNCKEYIQNWQDTYSIFAALDLVVTSCTSTAHLAGAMGTPVIVLVPLVPYFIWASDSIKWYPDNVKIIRQTKYNDWSDAVERLYNEVSRI